MTPKIVVIELLGYTEDTLTDEQYLALQMFFNSFLPEVEELYVMDGEVEISSEWSKVRGMILEDYPEVDTVDIYTLDSVEVLTAKTFSYKL